MLLILHVRKTEDPEIRVYSDIKDLGYEDCIIWTINGQDVFPYLRDWADKNVYYSKDPGVRLNYALASQAYGWLRGSFGTVRGEFLQRAILPENAYVDYGLEYNNTGVIISLRDD
ncbi:hypothetical protein BGX29_010914 [Mortierella sp. GBA35]|nr:hypothetical protein BGX29_010914 [Mortierella sp. GBA35]